MGHDTPHRDTWISSIAQDGKNSSQFFFFVDIRGSTSQFRLTNFKVFNEHMPPFFLVVEKLKKQSQ